MIPIKLICRTVFLNAESNGWQYAHTIKVVDVRVDDRLPVTKDDPEKTAWLIVDLVDLCRSIEKLLRKVTRDGDRAVVRDMLRNPVV